MVKNERARSKNGVGTKHKNKNNHTKTYTHVAHINMHLNFIQVKTPKFHFLKETSKFFF